MIKEVIKVSCWIKQSKARGVENNFDSRSDDMHLLHYVDSLWRIRAKWMGTYVKFDFKRISQLFLKERTIEIRNIASRLEIENAEAITTNRENLTGNRTKFINNKNTEKIERFKYTFVSQLLLPLQTQIKSQGGR